MKKTLRNQTEKWLEMQSKINSALKTLCAWCCIDETINLNEKGVKNLVLQAYPRTLTHHWIPIKDCKSTIADFTRTLLISVTVEPNMVKIGMEGFIAFVTDEKVSYSSKRVATDQARALKRLKAVIGE